MTSEPLSIVGASRPCSADSPGCANAPGAPGVPSPAVQRERHLEFQADARAELEQGEEW